MVINVILVPTLSSYQGAARREFLATVFPPVFRLASVLAGTVAVTGALLVYRFTGGCLSAARGRGSSARRAMSPR